MRLPKPNHHDLCRDVSCNDKWTYIWTLAVMQREGFSRHCCCHSKPLFSGFQFESRPGSVLDLARNSNAKLTKALKSWSTASPRIPKITVPRSGCGGATRSDASPVASVRRYGTTIRTVLSIRVSEYSNSRKLTVHTAAVQCTASCVASRESWPIQDQSLWSWSAYPNFRRTEATFQTWLDLYWSAGRTNVESHVLRAEPRIRPRLLPKIGQDFTHSLRISVQFGMSHVWRLTHVSHVIVKVLCVCCGLRVKLSVNLLNDLQNFTSASSLQNHMHPVLCVYEMSHGQAWIVIDIRLLSHACRGHTWFRHYLHSILWWLQEYLCYADQN